MATNANKKVSTQTPNLKPVPYRRSASQKGGGGMAKASAGTRTAKNKVVNAASQAVAKRTKGF